MMETRLTKPAIHRGQRLAGRHARGFSVVELIVVMSIAAILMTVAAPSMGVFVRNNRLQAQALDLMRMMHLARSEAVKRKTRVVLCRSGDPTTAVPACGGVSNTWTTGYLVFASGDSNSTYEAGTDELLRIGMPAGSGLTLVTNSTSNNNLEFNFDGTTNEAGGTARFAICDSRGGSVGRQIDVTPVGRPALSQGTSAQPVKCMSPT